MRKVRGAVMVEYAFLLVAVGMPLVIGLTLGGLALHHNYRTTRAVVLSPLP